MDDYHPFRSFSDEEEEIEKKDENVGLPSTVEIDMTPRYDIVPESEKIESLEKIVQDFRSSNRESQANNLREIRRNIAARGYVDQESFIEAYYDLLQRTERVFRMNPEDKPNTAETARTFKDWDMMRFVYGYAIGGPEALETIISHLRKQMLEEFVSNDLDQAISYFRDARKKEKTDMKKYNREFKRRRSDAFINAKRGREPESELPIPEVMPTLTMKDAEEAMNMSDTLLTLAVLAASGGHGVQKNRMDIGKKFDASIGAKPLRQRKQTRQVSPMPTIAIQPEEEADFSELGEEEADFSGVGEEEADFSGVGVPSLTSRALFFLEKYARGESLTQKNEEEVLGVISDIMHDRVKIEEGSSYERHFNWYKASLDRSIKERKPVHLKTGPLVTSEDPIPERNASYERVYGFISGLIARGMSFLGKGIVDVDDRAEKPRSVFEQKYDTPEQGKEAQKQYNEQVEQVVLADGEAAKQIEARRESMSEEEYVFAQITRAGRIISGVTSVAGLGTLAYKAFTVNDVTRRAAEVESRLGRAQLKVTEMEQYVDHLEKEGSVLGLFADPRTQQDFINSLDDGGKIKYAQKVAEVARNEIKRLNEQLNDPSLEEPIRRGWRAVVTNISDFLKNNEDMLERVQEGGEGGAEAAKEFLGDAAVVFGGKQGNIPQVVAFLRKNLAQMRGLIGGAVEKFEHFKRFARDDSFVAGLEEWAQDFFLWPVGGIVGSMIHRLYSGVEIAIRAAGTSMNAWSTAFSAFGGFSGSLGRKLGAGIGIAVGALPAIRPETIFELITVGTSVIGNILTGNILGVGLALMSTRAARSIGESVFNRIGNFAQALDRRYQRIHGKDDTPYQDSLATFLKYSKIAFQVYVGIVAAINIYKILISWFFSQFAAFAGIYIGSSILFFMYMTSIYNPGRLSYYLFQYFRKNKQALLSTIFVTYVIVLTVNFWLPEQNPLTIATEDVEFIDTAGDVTSSEQQEGIMRLDRVVDKLIDHELPNHPFVPSEESSIVEVAVERGGAATASWLGVV